MSEGREGAGFPPGRRNGLPGVPNIKQQFCPWPVDKDRREKEGEAGSHPFLNTSRNPNSKGGGPMFSKCQQMGSGHKNQSLPRVGCTRKQPLRVGPFLKEVTGTRR